MKLFGVAMLALTAVILIVSLVYIFTINRTKEKLAMLEKGIDPTPQFKARYFLDSMKAGMFILSIGVGFSLAVLLDEHVFVQMDNPGLYVGCVALSAGLGLILFYQIFKPK